MINYEKVTKLYSSGRGLRSLDLRFGPGIHGIVGRNGAGKTTALKLLVGLLSPDSGRITIDGAELGRRGDGYSHRRGIGYLPSDDYFFPFLSGRRNLEYLGYLRCGNRKAYETCLGTVEALDLAPYLDESFSSYSSGMKKKVQLVGSLIGGPGILIWDEPNNDVDLMANIYIRDLLGSLRTEGRTILLSSHVLEFMTGLVDSISVIDEGLLVAREEPVSSDLHNLFLAAIVKEESEPSQAARARVQP